MAVNRYADMLEVVPDGSFYKSAGQVVPYRGSKQSLLIRTRAANTEHRILLNGKDVGFVTSDDLGDASFKIQLDLGDNEIVLEQSNSRRRTVSYLTTRHSATLMASIAQSIEEVDSNIQQTKEDSILESSSVGMIEDVFGKQLSTPNSMQYELDTYRGVLRELRSAYRHYGGTIDGIRRVVGAYTQVNPLILPLSYGPAWRLGSNFADYSTIYSYVNEDVFSSVSYANDADLKVVSTDLIPGIYELSCNVSGQGVTFSITSGTTDVVGSPVAASALVDVPDGKRAPPIVGASGPYNIQSGLNDKITVDLGNGPLLINLTPGQRALTDVASELDAAVVASSQYGQAYAYSFYTGFADGTQDFSGQYLCVKNPVGTVLGLQYSGAGDALQTLFNLPNNRFNLASQATSGDDYIIVDGAAAVPIASEDLPLKLVLGLVPYAGPGAAPQPVIDAHPDEVIVTEVVDLGGGQYRLNLDSGLAHDHPQHICAYEVGSLPFYRQISGGKRKLSLSIGDISKLTTSWSCIFNVLGSGLPYGWIIKDSSGNITTTREPMLSCLGDARIVNGDSCIYLPVDKNVLNYKNFRLNVSVFGRGAIGPVGIESIGMSASGVNGTYDDHVPSISGYHSLQTGSPYRYATSFIIPSSASSVWIKVKVEQSLNKFVLERLNVDVDSVNGDVYGLHVGSGTIPRSDSRAKQGYAVYVWSPDRLTSTERSHLGIDILATERATIQPTSEPVYVEHGHIDKIAPASSWLERFDVSEYKVVDGVEYPVNIVGAYTHDHFIMDEDIDSNNMYPSTPIPERFSSLQPATETRFNSAVQFTTIAPHVATTTLTRIDPECTDAVLYENGVPLLSDEWTLLPDGSIEKIDAPVQGAQYMIEADGLTRFTTTVLDLGVNYQDYTWYADAHVWLRPDIIPDNVDLTVGLDFDTSGIATLESPSNGNKLNCVMTVDDGTSTDIVPASAWAFTSLNTVRLYAGDLGSGYQYSLKYVSSVSMSETSARYVIEVRSSDLDDLSAELWKVVTQNDVIDCTKRYHQLRITVRGIGDVRDVKVYSLVLKGLNMYGTNGVVPFLRKS